VGFEIVQGNFLPTHIAEGDINYNEMQYMCQFSIHSGLVVATTNIFGVYETNFESKIQNRKRVMTVFHAHCPRRNAALLLPFALCVLLSHYKSLKSFGRHQSIGREKKKV